MLFFGGKSMSIQRKESHYVGVMYKPQKESIFGSRLSTSFWCKQCNIAIYIIVFKSISLVFICHSILNNSIGFMSLTFEKKVSEEFKKYVLIIILKNIWYFFAASDFEVGECWGYNRFFRLDLLVCVLCIYSPCYYFCVCPKT